MTYHMPCFSRALLATALLASAPALSAQSDSPANASAQSDWSLFSDNTSAIYAERNLPVTWRSQVPACLDARTSVPLYRSPVFLSYTTNDTTNPLQLSQANVIAADIVREIRARLGAPTDSAVDGSARVSWRALPTSLRLTAAGDGPITEMIQGPRADSSASSLLSVAFQNARRAGTALMPWRNKPTGEPVVVTLWLYAPAVDSMGKWKRPDPDDTELTAFWIPLPTHSYAGILRSPKLRYPKENQKRYAEGDVTLRFAVNGSGRADSTTIHDIPPSANTNGPRMSSDEYEEFRDATREWVLNSDYAPERIAGCVIESVLEQPVKFRFRP
jgi:hypothetical protein